MGSTLFKTSSGRVSLILVTSQEAGPRDRSFALRRTDRHQPRYQLS